MQPPPQGTERDTPHRTPHFLARLPRFGAVGAIGFLIDSGVLYAAIGLGLDHYSSRFASFFAAVTATWLANRNLTFGQTNRPTVAEWLRYMLTNLSGGFVNLGTYIVLTLNIDAIYERPIIAVAIGSLAGLFVNYAFTRLFVFK